MIVELTEEEAEVLRDGFFWDMMRAKLPQVFQGMPHDFEWYNNLNMKLGGEDYGRRDARDEDALMGKHLQ